jgi:hypothetical protein
MGVRRAEEGQCQCCRGESRGRLSCLLIGLDVVVTFHALPTTADGSLVGRRVHQQNTGFFFLGCIYLRRLYIV